MFKMYYPIADLHCDLLSFLEGNSRRTAYDPASLCSVSQLKQGNIRIQTLAIFVRTGPESVRQGMAQAGIYKRLNVPDNNDFIPFECPGDVGFLGPEIATVLAFENASGFSYEDEPIKEGFDRLGFVTKHIARPLYISLTWNMENRFGGGAATSIGLKEDGKRLLDYLDGTGIAVDFSHTSDSLAHDILTYIDRQRIRVPVLASHSNSRSVMSVPRNLPDEIAKEIIRRKGILGINFYRKFVGSEPNDSFLKHIAYWIDLGAGSQICFGADFFYEEGKSRENFFPGYDDASCYPRFIDLCRHRLHLSEQMLEQICYKNFLTFMNVSYRFNDQRCKTLGR